MKEIDIELLGLTIVGAAKAISEYSVCTKEFQRLYKSYKRYWSRSCERYHRVMREQDDKATVSSRLVLHVLILAEHNDNVKQAVVKLMEIHMKDLLHNFDAMLCDSTVDVGNCALVGIYYRRLAGKLTEVDHQYMQLFPSIYNDCLCEKIVEAQIKDKSNMGRTTEDRVKLLVSHIWAKTGVRLEVCNIEDDKFLGRAVKATCGFSERELFKVIAEICYTMTQEIIRYREAYLELAIKPEIDHNRKWLLAPDIITKFEMEKIELEQRINELASELEKQKAHYERKQKDIVKAHMSEVAALNKEIRNMQSGKSKKH